MDNYRTRPENKNNLAETRHQYSTTFRDFAVISVIAILVYAVSSVFNLYELLDNWIEQYEVAQFDEFLVVLLILAFAFAIFAVRRWRELKIEISKHRQTEATLRKSEANYRDLFESAYDIHLRLDKEGNILDINRRGAALTGYSQSELRHMNVFQHLIISPDQEVIRQMIRDAMQGKKGTYEVRWQIKTGEIVHFDGATTTQWDENGKFLSAHCTLRDVTKRKQTELALEESQRRLQAIFDNALEVMLLADDEGCYVDVNPAACALTGYTRAELLEMGVWDLTPEPNRELDRALWRDFIAAGQQSGEYTLRRRDGTLVETEFHAVANIVPGLHLSISRNITERKRAEEALRQQAQIIDQIHDSVISCDLDGYVTGWNKGAERLFGYLAAEALEQHISFVYPQDQHQFLQQEVIAPLKEKGEHEIEVRIQKKSGQDFYAHLSLSLLKDNTGSVTGMIGYSMDITERKQAEQALRQSEQKFRSLAENLPDIITRFDRQLRHIYVNQQVETLTDMKTEAFLDKSNRELGMPPDLVGFWEQALFEVFETGQIKTIEYMYPTPRGDFAYYESRLVPEFAPDRSVETVLSISRDITERKQTEDELNYQKERLQRIVDNIPVMIVFISPDGKTEWFNREWQRVLGWTLAEAQSRDILVEMYPDPDDRQEVLDFALHPPSGWRDFRTRVKDGRVLDTAWANVLLSDGSSIGIGQDITERKQAERSLRRYAERLEIQRQIDQAVLASQSPEVIGDTAVRRLRELIPYARASIVILDLDAHEGEVLIVQTGGKSRLGGGVRISLDLFGDVEKLKQGEVHMVENIVDLPSTIPELQALQADGVSSYINVPLISGGELLGTLNLGAASVGAFAPEQVEIAREIADSLAVAIQDAQLFEQVRSAHERLHRLSRQLLEVQETERRHVALELHDQIGQNLTAIKLNLQAAQRTTQASPLVSILEQGIATVERALQRVRNLSLDLRPSMLDDLGLVAALRWYVDRLARQTDLTIAFTAEGLKTRPDPTLDTTCFRVAQEALTNVIRHAQARQVQIELWQQEVELNLLIRDDGRGFDAAAALKEGVRGNSVGLLGMQERVELAGGRFEIESSRGYGTEIRARFPLTNTGKND